MRKIYLISALPKSDVINDDEIVYKIGITKQAKDKRLKQLQTGTDKKLEIVKEFSSNYPFKVEGNLHRYFQHKKINREWFKLDSNDLQIFLTLCEQYEKNFKLLEDSGNQFIK
jgi:hypothetical protein